MDWSATRKGRAEDVLAEALGQHDGADGAAAGEGDEEFVFAGAAEEVVAAQKTRGAADYLAEEFVAGVGAEARVPMAEVVNIEEDHAERGFGALDAVGFAEEHGEDGFAVVDAGEAVGLGVEDDGFAERVEFEGAAAGELDLIDAETPVSGFGGSGDEVVDYAFGEAVGEFLGDGVGDEEDGEGAGWRMARALASKLAEGDAGEGGVKQRQGGGMRRGDGGEGGFSGEDDFRVGSGGEEDGLDGGQEGGVGRSEQEGWRGGGSWWENLCSGLHRRRLEII
jgi:hypothetical protein